MKSARSLSTMLAVAGGLAAVVAVPTRALASCGYTPQPSFHNLVPVVRESAAEREARLAQARAHREARMAARAARKAEKAAAAAAAATPAAPTS